MTEKELAELLEREGLTEEDVPEALRRERNRKRRDETDRLYHRIWDNVNGMNGPLLQDILAEVPDQEMFEELIGMFASSAHALWSERDELEQELLLEREEARLERELRALQEETPAA